MDHDSTPAGNQEGLGSARRKWWFTPVMWIVAGAAVAAFQWGPISGSTANWLNWLVAIAGMVLLVFGVVELFRARPGGRRAE